jgi:hypothetical protein
MLEAAIVDLVFTVSLKRSTLYRQLSTSRTADYPIFGPEAVIARIADHQTSDTWPARSVAVYFRLPLMISLIKRGGTKANEVCSRMCRGIFPS